MAQLLQIMQKEVDAFVENFQTDFTVHDTNYLLEKAKPGERYYWLIRRNGTQLYNEVDLIIEDEAWNERALLYYFKKTDKKFFELTVTSNSDGVLEGEIKEVDYDATCRELKGKIKNPTQLEIAFKGETVVLDWESVGRPSEVLHFLSDYFKEPMYWAKFDYQYIFN